MLESMVKKPRPTRAEGSDVANAILDGADCVMLSGETAKGDYALQCIQTMVSLAREAEACIWNGRFFEDIMRSDQSRNAVINATQTTSIAAVQASYSIQAAAIVAITTTGRTAKLCAKYRPACPIIAITRFAEVSRQMQIHRGIIPLYYKEGRVEDWTRDVEERIQLGVDLGKKSGFIKSGQTIVCITGWRKGAGSSNCIRIV
jgi:pyruvate kinase